MIRKGNLYETIISVENLELADKKAQRQKSKQRGIIRHNKNRKSNILRLHEILKNRTYKTSRYKIFTIKEPKERTISSLPYYPNRIVHWAIMNILEPIFTKCFISQTYSCIRKRGIHKCLNVLKDYFNNKAETEYCLKFDIKKFYPSIDKEILKQKLSNKFKDEDLLNLLFEIIASHEKGLPLGNLLSQWFGNFYLNGFDHWLKEEKGVKYYLRYCDDCVILSDNKPYLHSLREQIQLYLKEIGLELSNYQVFPVSSRGIDFLGYPNFHEYRLLRKSIKQRYKRMMKKYRNTKSMNAYRGWILHCNGKNLLNKYN